VQDTTRKKKRDIRSSDRIFLGVLKVFAFGLFAVLVGIGVFLFVGALPTIKQFGFSFLFSSVWDPVADQYGALPVIFGTLCSSFLALIFAAPLSVGIALFLNELLPASLSSFLGFLIEMLAAIPSVVYGLWGVFILAPFLRVYVEPTLAKFFGFLPLFSGPPYGVGMLAAGIILAIMIIPTISSICKEIFKAIPRYQREAAIALGASRWETMRLSVLKSSTTGIYGAVFLGLGRALGETMAVTMVIGNRAQISASLFAPAQTMASVIANEYVEAGSDIHLAALIEVGLILFIITLLVNALARFIVQQSRSKGGRHAV
jgi:phosphate transport system permease protein